MTRRASPKLAGYLALAAVGLLGALVFGRPELVALAAPFLLAAAGGLALASEPRLTVRLALDAERALESETVTARVTLRAERAVARVDVLLPLPDGLATDTPNPVALRLAAGEERELALALRCERWGGHLVGPVRVRAHDALGLLAWEAAAPERPALRVYPTGQALRRLVPPRETQAFAGNQVARPKGEGIEFADIRPRTVGDPLKRVNWRASARRGELWVNESHPERNADVIVFLDSFAEARLGREGTLDLAVRATTAIAAAAVGRRDRVGLIGFGGVLRWLQPGGGLVQLYRLVDALLDTEIVLSYSWREIRAIPRRTLPPKALVIALTPLLDPRGTAALLDLRARGIDLAVIDVSPEPFVRPGGADLDALAHRIWRLRRETIRHRLQRSGVAVAEWRGDEPLQAALEEVTAFRRFARHAYA